MTLDLNQLSAITEKKFVPKLQDNVYGTNPVIARMTRPGKKQTYSGGTKIVVPVISSVTGSSNKYFDNYDTLDTSPTDNISAAQFDHKQLFEPIKISRKEELISSGDAAKIKLVAAKMKIAEASMRDNLALGLFSDGTAGTGALSAKQLTGFRAMLSTSSTYGGIAVADLATWVAQIDGNSGTNRAISLNLLQKTFGACTFEDMKPGFLTCLQNIHDVIWSLYQPHQRLMSKEMESLGFTGVLEFNGAPIIVDSHNPANSVIMINEEVSQLYVHEQEDMRYEKITQIETQAATVGRIFFMGNFTCSGRRYNGQVQDLTSS